MYLCSAKKNQFPIYEIIDRLEECKETGDSILEIIHGYKHNTIIRDYIRSTKFIEKMTQKGLDLYQFARENNMLPDPNKATEKSVPEIPAFFTK